jgi:hypothetical protein
MARYNYLIDRFWAFVAQKLLVYPDGILLNQQLRENNEL